MNPLVVLSALVAVASAAPSGYPAGLGYAGYGLGYAGYAGHPALGYAGLAHGYVAAAPAAIAYSNVNAAVPAPLHDNGQSPGLPALVTKTAITAAGRPVTHITPHVKRLEPEITYKKVDVAVPVAHPVPVQRPVPVAAPYAVTPVVQSIEVVQPVVQPIVHHGVTAVRTAHVAAPAAVGYSALAPGYGLGYAGHGLGSAGHGLGYAAHGLGYAGHGLGYAGHGLGYAGHGLGYAGLAHRGASIITSA